MPGGGRADETGKRRSQRVVLVCERHAITLFEASIWSHWQDPELPVCASYEALTGEQRQWLEEAAHDATARSAALTDADVASSSVRRSIRAHQRDRMGQVSAREPSAAARKFTI